jgi:hypothetical protein
MNKNKTLPSPFSPYKYAFEFSSLAPATLIKIVITRCLNMFIYTPGLPVLQNPGLFSTTCLWYLISTNYTRSGERSPRSLGARSQCVFMTRGYEKFFEGRAAPGGKSYFSLPL